MARTRKYLKTLTDSQLRNNISLYANLKDKYSETIGEVFADVHVNGDNADILSKKIKCLMLERLNIWINYHYF